MWAEPRVLKAEHAKEVPPVKDSLKTSLRPTDHLQKTHPRAGEGTSQCNLQHPSLSKPTLDIQKRYINLALPATSTTISWDTNPSK
jgi:hypothetical protein